MNKVTLGITSYKRPEQLKKLLINLQKQSFKDFEILVSINGYAELKKIDQAKTNAYLEIYNSNKYNKNINFKFQNENIGIIENHFYLLSNCKTEYFMWLADDDQISEKCIETLYKIMDEDKSIVSAVPVWEYVDSKHLHKLIIPSNFSQKNFFFRFISYCSYSDDAFFNSLHRTKMLKNCSFPGFWKINSKTVSRWAYLFIVDIIIQGRVYFCDNSDAKWINYEYTKKYYNKDEADKIKRYLINLLKTINIYTVYFLKLFKWKKFIHAPLILPFLVMFLIRDLLFGNKVKFKKYEK